MGHARAMTSTMRRRRRSVLIGVLAVTLLSCGKAAEPSDDEAITDVTVESGGPVQSGGALAVGLDAETNGWDPTMAAWADSGYQVAKAIFDPLAAFDAELGVRPYLAESFESNDDFTEWTIKLREDVDFHDGSPVDAEAVAANLEAHRTSPITSGIMRPVSAVEIVDPLTVEVKMNVPWSTFPGYLTAQPGYIAAPSMLDDPDGSSNPIGSGPFVFEEWVPDSSLKVSKNEDYWREGFPLFDAIEFQVLADDTTRRQGLESGQVDMIQVNQASQLVDFESRAEDGEFQFVLDDQAETPEIALALNTAKPPFDNPTAREAVATAIDTKAISDTIFEGVFEPATGPFTERSPFFAETDYPLFDAGRAAELADEYEASRGEPLRFSLKAPPDPAILEIMQFAQQQLAASGIDMEIESPEQSQLLIDALVGNYEAMGWISFGSATGEGEYIFLHSDNVGPIGQLSLAFTRLRNGRLDAALDKLRAQDFASTASAGDIEQATAAVQKELAADLAWVFIVHMTSAVVAQNNLRDVTQWTLPDGEPGLGQQGSVVSLYQLWRED